jgi:hypothetical protein
MDCLERVSLPLSLNNTSHPIKPDPFLKGYKLPRPEDINLGSHHHKYFEINN